MKQLLGSIALAATVVIVIVGCGSPSTQSSSSAPPAASSTAATFSPGLQEVAGVGELAFFDKSNQTIDAFDQGRLIPVQMINSTRFSELLVILTEIARNAVARI